MKKFIACLLLWLLATGYCEARTFGCFAGILDYSNERDSEIDYKNYSIINKQKNTTNFMPFVGCGITFDF